MLECLIHSSSSSNFEVSAGKYTSLLLLILRIISKGDYYNWLEFYFEILNYNIQGLVFWAVLFGFFFVWFGFLLFCWVFFLQCTQNYLFWRTAVCSLNPFWLMDVKV